MEIIKTWLADLQAWLTTASGKLSTAAAIVASSAAWIAANTELFAVAASFLPFPLDILAIVGICAAVIQAPKMAAKRDAGASDVTEG